MLNERQKVVLSILERTPERRAPYLHLVDWLFLLREEEHLRLSDSFYDFFPYKLGPFSFLLRKELGDLEKMALIRFEKQDVVGEETEDLYSWPPLPPDITGPIHRVLKRHGRKPQEEILDHISVRFPWYASRLRPVTALQMDRLQDAARPSVYTFGYEGVSIDAALDSFLGNQLANVIDVRRSPFSPVYGFAAGELKLRCEDLGIRYVHFPELGLPPLLRRGKDRSALWQAYESEVLSQAHRTVTKAAVICSSAPTALFCYEKDPAKCHRSVLARHISRLVEMPVYHYSAAEREWWSEPKSPLADLSDMTIRE